MGLSRLEREFKSLETEWPDDSYALRVLLGGCGRMRKGGSMPSALMVRLERGQPAQLRAGATLAGGGVGVWVLAPMEN